MVPRVVSSAWSRRGAGDLRWHAHRPGAEGRLKTADSWRSGRLKATDMPLGQVLERLAGYQGQRLWMMDEQVAHRRVSGDFNLDRPGESLQSLADAQHLQLQGVLGTGLWCAEAGWLLSF
jgi:ferric-dicitrate binding protein FerR (iron transport regulator)